MRRLKYDSADGVARRDLGEDVIDFRHRSSLDRNSLSASAVSALFGLQAFCGRKPRILRP